MRPGVRRLLCLPRLSLAGRGQGLVTEQDGRWVRVAGARNALPGTLATTRCLSVTLERHVLAGWLEPWAGMREGDDRPCLASLDMCDMQWTGGHSPPCSGIGIQQRQVVAGQRAARREVLWQDSAQLCTRDAFASVVRVMCVESQRCDESDGRRGPAFCGD